jgi:hypothetical protein
MHDQEKSDSGIVVMQCRLRHCITYADWRTMPNGFRKPQCSRGVTTG